MISTFNSGVRQFRKVNSNVHVSIDESEAGRILGARLTALGVSGTALCVVHEAENVALQERCDGLAEGNGGGSVDLMSVAEFGVDDLDGVENTIADRLLNEATPIGLVVGLNHNVTLAAVEAVKELGDDADADVEIARIRLHRATVGGDWSRWSPAGRPAVPAYAGDESPCTSPSVGSA